MKTRRFSSSSSFLLSFVATAAAWIWSLQDGNIFSVEARRWTDMTTFHSLGQKKPSPSSSILTFSLLTEVDPLFNSAAPTYQPTAVPTSIPTTETPSMVPSFTPSTSHHPTDKPTFKPTRTDPPSFRPTYKPTPLPTADPYPYNPAPSNPPRGYFNYDTSPTALYGPGQPKEVQHNSTTKKIEFFNNGWRHRWQPPNDWYWHEFDATEYSNPDDTWYGWIGFRKPAINNWCQSVGLQSPVDVTSNGADCFEYHQIRPARGDIPYKDVKAVIEPNKLRLIVPRRPCKDIDPGLPPRDGSNIPEECMSPIPPGADLPHWWSNKADVTHVDVKIPSEHLLEGKRYDMEFQIWMLHGFKRRNPVVSIMVEATPGGYNAQFQKLLLLWQQTWKKDIGACRRFRRERKRNLQQEHEEEEEMANPDFYEQVYDDLILQHEHDISAINHRDLQSDSSIFNPFDDAFVKTIYFLGYEGSQTEPPCGQWVSWRVLDTPFTVSYTQLFQAQHLLFNHMDEKCRRTSVHTRDYRVTRPIQDTFKRPIHKCTSKDYVSDAQKAIWVSQGLSPQVPGKDNQ